MKKSLIFIFVLLSSGIIYSQRDTIVLLNGEEKVGTIGRVENKNLYFLEKYHKGYKKIDLDQVRSYSINDDFFKMSPSNRMEAEFIYSLEGYTSDEIYRALIDWIQLNQKVIFSNGLNFTNEEHKIVIGSLFSEEYFQLDLLTLLSLIGDMEVNTYSLHYTVSMRAKDNRFKISISNVGVVNTIDNSQKKELVELYKRRANKDGLPTINYEAIKKIKALLAKQLLEIKDHVAYVRANDTFENRLIETMLLDDEW